MSYGINIKKVCRMGVVSLLVTQNSGQGYILTGEIGGQIRYDFASATGFINCFTEKQDLVKIEADLVELLERILVSSDDFSQKTVQCELAKKLPASFPWFFPKKPKKFGDPVGSVQAI